MQVVRSWRDVPPGLKGAVLAIGNFDGVHRGHQAVLGEAIDIAKREGRRAGAVIFEPHPREFFAPDKPFFRLTPLPLKLELLAALGLDQTFVIGFDAALAALGPEAFAAEVVANGFGASHVVVGHDFAYGRGRSGTALELAAFGRKLGFGVDVVAPVGTGATTFSSSRIRDYLRQGKVREAADQLGYWWRVRGRVSEGAGRGKGLGFPTLNLPLAPGQEIGHGIYAMRVNHRGKRAGPRSLSARLRRRSLRRGSRGRIHRLPASRPDIRQRRRSRRPDARRLRSRARDPGSGRSRRSDVPLQARPRPGRAERYLISNGRSALADLPLLVS
jgi:riboflavin kinase/FMN adenylyltransferase